MFHSNLRSIAGVVLALVVSLVTLGVARAADKFDVAKQFEGKLIALTPGGEPAPYEAKTEPQFYLIYFAASW